VTDLPLVEHSEAKQAERGGGLQKKRNARTELTIKESYELRHKKNSAGKKLVDNVGVSWSGGVMIFRKVKETFSEKCQVKEGVKR